jgi:hypothetical protein
MIKYEIDNQILLINNLKGTPKIETRDARESL